MQSQSACRACQNGLLGARISRRNARNARARFARQQHRPAAGSGAERAVAAGPAGPARLEAAADQQRGRPRHQLPARVSAQCGSREQPHQSRLLGALLRDPHAPPRAWTAAHNSPFPENLRLWTSTQFSTIPVALIFDGRRHLLAMVLGSPTPADRGSSAQGRLQ